MAKTGRPGSRVFDPKGNLIAGLSYRKGRYYYPTGHRDVNLGDKLLPAIQAYHDWKARQEGKRVELVEKLNSQKWPNGATVSIVNVHEVPDHVLLSKIGEWLGDASKRQLIEDATGWPVTRLESLPAVGKPIALADAHSNYTAKVKQISKGEQDQIRWAWESFVKSVAVSQVRQVTKEKVNSWIAGLVKDYAPKTVKNRVSRVKAVLAYNAKHEHDVTSCERVIRWIAAHDLPNNTLSHPKPIKRDDFYQLLEAAELLKGGYTYTYTEKGIKKQKKVKAQYWRAMLLVALNSAYYGIDIIELPVSSVDLESGTISFTRGKTDTPRVSVLWKQTIKALKPVLANRAERRYVFETYRKAQWSKKGFLNSFGALRQAAGLERLEFNQIRDGALTAAAQGEKVTEKEVKILAGHGFAGVTDMYIQRNPKMVRTACEAIEEFYFGKPKMRRKGVNAGGR